MPPALPGCALPTRGHLTRVASPSSRRPATAWVRCGGSAVEQRGDTVLGIHDRSPGSGPHLPMNWRTSDTSLRALTPPVLHDSRESFRS